MKPFLALAACILVAASGPALDVDKQELARLSGQTVVFENFQGPPAKVETRDQIKGIGRFLASEKKAYFDRYEVIRVADPAAPAGFDADIFIIKPGAGVDHIRNLRNILAGYLEIAYGFSPADSFTLAEFVTIYNAVYRGRTDFFRTNYKAAVISMLDPAKAGLARSYKEWPGGTQMLIPLSDRTLKADKTPETAALVTPEVVGDLKSSPSKGLEERKAMVELQERQLGDEKKALVEEKKSLAVEKKEAAVMEKAAAAELAKLESRPAPAEPAETTAASGQAQAGAQTGPAAAAPAAEAKKAELKQELAKVEEKKQEIAAREKKVETVEATIKEKESTVKDQREDIARDQQKAIEEKKAAAKPKGVPFFLTRDSAGPRGTLVSADPADGALLAASGLVLAGPTRLAFAERMAFIAQAGGSGRLTLVDMDNWKPVAAGREEVFERSSLAAGGDGLFAVIKDGPAWVVGRYDKILDLTAKSTARVNPFTDLVIAADRLLVQNEDGKILSLSAKTLEGPPR